MQSTCYDYTQKFFYQNFGSVPVNCAEIINALSENSNLFSKGFFKEMGLDNSLSLKILYNSNRSIFKIKNIAMIGCYFPPVLDNNPYLKIDKGRTELINFNNGVYNSEEFSLAGEEDLIIPKSNFQNIFFVTEYKGDF